MGAGCLSAACACVFRAYCKSHGCKAIQAHYSVLRCAFNVLVCFADLECAVVCRAVLCPHRCDLEGSEPGCCAACCWSEGAPLHLPSRQDQHSTTRYEQGVWAECGRTAAGAARGLGVQGQLGVRSWGVGLCGVVGGVVRVEEGVWAERGRTAAGKLRGLGVPGGSGVAEGLGCGGGYVGYMWGATLLTGFQPVK
jgi:hypothetical protein